MKINISIDDVSPHPFSSTKVIDRCHELIKVFPDIKFSLFVPTGYWRTIRDGTRTKSPLLIHEFGEFCSFLKSLPKKNFEVCYHGHFHGIPGKSDNDEFQYLTYEEAIEKFQTMFKVVKLADLQEVFRPVFRPPAWRMSPEAIRAALDMGIKTLALSPKDYAKKVYDGADSSFPNVVYYNCNPPFDPLNAHDKVEIVYHACEWDKNHFNRLLSLELLEWIRHQKNDVQFEFIDGLL
jgi:hypothetical protein